MIVEREESIPDARDSLVRVINIETGQQLWIHRLQDSKAEGMVVSAVNGLVAVACAQGKVTFLNLRSGKVEKSLDTTGTLSTIARTADGQFLAIGGRAGTVTVWPFDNRDHVEPTLEFKAARDAIQSLQFCANNVFLLVGSQDGTASYWRTVLTEDEKFVIPCQSFRYEVSLWCARLDSRREYLTTTDRRGNVSVHKLSDVDVQNPEFLDTRKFSTMTPDEKRRIAFGSIRFDVSQDGRFVVGITNEGIVQIWDLQQNKLTREITGEQLREMRPEIRSDALPDSVRFRPHSRIASIQVSNITVMLDAETGEPASPYPVLDHPKHTYLTYKHDGSMAALREYDALNSDTVIVDLKSRRLVKRLNFYTSDLAWTPDGSSLIVSNYTREFVVWDTVTWEEKARFVCEGPIMAVSPDGRTLATSNGTEILLWNLATYREMMRIPLQQPIGSLRFSAGGTALHAHYRNPFTGLQFVWALTSAPAH